MGTVSDADAELQPRLTLQLPPLSRNTSEDVKAARISSLCFLPNNDNDNNNIVPDDFSLMLKSQQLLSRNDKLLQQLEGRLLASSHGSGDAKIWDLGTKRVVHTFAGEAAGLAVKSLSTTDKSLLAHQTRDGQVTLYDLQSYDAIVKWQTGSRTFLAMAVDSQNEHLWALPCEDPTSMCLRDVRTSSSSPLRIRASQEKDGMLMSMAVCGKRIACGMEGGRLVMWDVRNQAEPLVSSDCCKLSDTFLLGLDLTRSTGDSLLAVVGMAGLNDDDDNRQETVALVKYNQQKQQLKIKHRVTTCRPTGDGKPGVNVARFRPSDGRIFCVGGWDKRLRLYSRSCCKPLAILKGHEASVAALDWSMNDNWMASGSTDGTIHLWNTNLHGDS